MGDSSVAKLIRSFVNQQVSQLRPDSFAALPCRAPRTMAAVKRQNVAKPPFTIGTLRKAIPAHCFERSALHSAAYLLVDILLVAALYAASTYIDPAPLPTWFKYTFLWPTYWFFQVCACHGSALSRMVRRFPGCAALPRPSTVLTPKPSLPCGRTGRGRNRHLGNRPRVRPPGARRGTFDGGWIIFLILIHVGDVCIPN